VLHAGRPGEVDLGFVPIENAIEGTVNVTLDALAFEHDLLIQREVVIPSS
jgi:prephenate dehydratase